MHDPMYMIVNLALGGIAGTPGADLADGAEMKIDWNRAYALDDAAVPDDANGGDDTLIGTAAADTLDGGGGNDVISGLAGDDLLLGGPGDDSLQGGGGTDSYNGGAGSDTLVFAGARAALHVDLAAGVMTTASGSETFTSIENVIGGRADDRLTGDAGANALRGGDGNDLLTGAGGDDLLDGGAGADTYRFAALNTAGGDGDDSIVGFARGQDILAFDDVADADDDGDSDLDDLLASVSEISDGGAGGDVTVAFDNGASITFVGSGAGGADSLTDLVNDAATQIQVS
jgi:Ca2+-binding RTX toxin-like protein